MFDYSVLTVDVEALLLENEINLAKALELLTLFSIQEKAKSQKIYPETIDAQKKGICIRMMKAFEGQELPVKVYPGARFKAEHEGQTGYYFEDASSLLEDVITWAREVGIPVPEGFLVDKVTLEDEPVDIGDSAKVDHVSDLDPKGLSVKNIQDPDLVSFGDKQYPAAKFYGALFAGLFMARTGGAVRKEQLEIVLKKMGFVGDLKLKDKDFQALWKAIPKPLKIPGKPAVQ